jgi:outer membrane receptor protein involved in Fe transport
MTQLSLQRAIAAVLASLAATATVHAQEAPASPAVADATEVLVIGSRIPRAQTAGPAPVTVITAEDIRADGYTSVPELLRGLAQNAGETQSQQSFSGSSFTPGAQQVDLRGLGSNHTLVLVNGRRIADFPLPFKGRSNFTDISNIPLGMVESVEVLSGSASAVYGSDAVAGVINFNLRRKVTDFTVDYRVGTTEHGGGTSNRFSFAGGWASGDLDVVFGAELQDQKPLWAYSRPLQDSTADNPVTATVVGRRTFLQYDPVGDGYVDPGAATCAPLANLNGGTTYYAARPRWAVDGGPGRYCGSNESIGYGTILSERKSLSTFTSVHYRLDDRTELFADLQLGISRVGIYRDVLDWQFEDATGSEDGVFFNNAIGALDSWYRQFTPEESGGLGRGFIRNHSTAFTFTPGITGEWDGGWRYEAALNHSQYRSKVRWPVIVSAAANRLFLGPQLGVDPDSGYPIFNAPTSRLYRPLTTTEYAGIAQNTEYTPQSKTTSLSFSVTQPALFRLPAGEVGLAAVVEGGRQSYALNPDPLALVPTYYGLVDSDGTGSRNHLGSGVELRIPVLESVGLSTAARYDRYQFAGNTAGKFTWNAGLEWRPLEQLLVRGSYGTGFRAPDLHYVFAGAGDTHPSATDYYRCRTEEADLDLGDCSWSDVGIVEQRVGNRQLQAETSTSVGFGVVWSPLQGLDFSVDYYRIRLANEVLDMNLDSVLRDEADCRLGVTDNGATVNATSPTCVDAIARVRRNPLTAAIDPGGLASVAINPINVAGERTAGLDFSLHARWPTPLGEFSLRSTYSRVRYLTLVQYPGDPVEDKLAADSGYYIPKSKASASLGWSQGAWGATLHAQRLDKLPNWDEDAYIKASYLYNASVQYQFADGTDVNFVVDNLLDEDPVKDATYASYPYYDINWFDTQGRTFYLQLSKRFGGKR